MPKTKKSRSSNVGIAPAMPYSTGGKKDGSMRGQAQSNNNLIAPNTSIGQHFLKNPAVVNSIVQKSGVKVGLDYASISRDKSSG
jgi:18S rRNA (adenine1779-N6/adenine1780-N6)-dimethyltransferase